MATNAVVPSSMGSKASIVFHSIGHFFATVFAKAKVFLPALQATAGTVETVTAAVPVYGPLGLTVEKAAYAVLGEVASVVNAVDAAGKAKLADAGLDIQVIATVEALIAGVPEIAALAKAL